MPQEDGGHLCPLTAEGSGLSNAAPGPAGLVQPWDEKWGGSPAQHPTVAVQTHGVAVPGWAGFGDGQDSRKDRTPGQTHPQCSGGFSWSRFVPDSQLSSLNITLATLSYVCAF